MGRTEKEMNFVAYRNSSQTPMISASASSEGPPPAPPPPHHPLIGPPSVTMTQLPMPLPLPLPLYPHHQLAPPPHPYHALHHHQHAAAAAAVAMMAFEHQHGRHHMAHHLGTVPPPGRSPSPPRFLRPPPPPSRGLLPYNGVRSPEGAETRVEEGPEVRGDEGPGAVNLVHKRPDPNDDSSAGKRSRMVNGGLGGRPLGPSEPIGGFVSHGGMYASGPPYYSSTSTLMGHSPPATTCSSFKQHPLLVPHSLVTPRPHHPEQSTVASSMVAPTFTSPAITVGPITTPSFSYDPFFAAGAQSSVKPGQSVLRRPSATRLQQPTTAFKVPSGKEGSLKHRLLLTRSSESYGTAPPSPTSAGKRRKGKEPASPPEAPRISPASSPPVTSKSPLEECFSKGSLIRLRGGRVVKVEELRTEDFVKSAEGSEGIRLDPSTVVGLEERPDAGTARLTLAYGSERQRSQVELESTLEQPFFVVGRGWASVCPERSLRRFGLSCLRLRVGHVCISLTERLSTKSASEKDDKTTAFDIKSSDDTKGEKKPSSHLPSGMSNDCSGLKKSEETFISSESNLIGSGDMKSVNNNHSSSNQHSEDKLPLSPSSRRRRWSAPGPLSTDDEEEVKVAALIQPNRTSVEVVHSAVES